LTRFQQDTREKMLVRSQLPVAYNRRNSFDGKGLRLGGAPRRRKSFGINDLQLFYLFWKTLAKSGFYLRAKRIFCSYVYRGQVKFSFFWSLNYAIWYG